MTRLQVFGTYTLLLQGMLIVYGWSIGNFPLPISSLLNIILIFFYYLNKAKYTRNGELMPKELIIYFVWCIFSHLVTVSSSSEIVPLQLLLNFLVAGAFFNLLDYSYLLKLYRKIAAVVIAFFLFQIIYKNIVGYYIPGKISFFPILVDYGDIRFVDRCMSFFAEASHMAEWTLPLLCIEQFNEKRKLWRILVLVIVLLFLRSGTAILGLVSIFLFYLYHVYFGNSSFKIKILTIIAGIVVLSFSIWFLGTEMGQYLISRSDELSTTSANDSSGYVRIFRGYSLWQELSPLHKIIGCDSSIQLEEYISHIRGYFNLAAQNLWLNGFQFIIIRTGLIGLILIFLFVHRLWNNNTSTGKCLIFTWIMVSLIHNNFMDSVTFIFFILALKEKLRSNYSQSNSTVIH